MKHKKLIIISVIVILIIIIAICIFNSRKPNSVDFENLKQMQGEMKGGKLEE